MIEQLQRILFLAANPQGTSQLRLDEEAKQIRKGLERSQGRSKFVIETRWAVDANELRRALLDVEPHIVHFSGHGMGNATSALNRANTRDVGPVLRSGNSNAEGLVLQTSDGRPKLASSRALANLFGLFPEQIECVLLNACYSEIQAEAIHQHVDNVIGMNRAIGDEAAISFAVGFYDALGASRPYDTAYKFGCSAIDFTDLEQSSIPVLKARMRPVDVQNNESDDESDSIAKPTPSEAESTASATAQTAIDLVLENPEGQVPLASSFYKVIREERGRGKGKGESLDFV